MLYQYMTPDNPLYTIDLTLSIISVAITYILGLITIILYIKVREQKSKFEKENIITWILFFLLLGTANLLQIVWRYMIADASTAELIDYISIICKVLGICIKIINIERAINHSELYSGYFFSIIAIIWISMAVILNPVALREVNILHVIYLVTMMTGSAVFFIIFVYLAVKTTGEPRKNAIKVVIAAIFIFFGSLFQPQNLEDYRERFANPELIMSILTITSPLSNIIAFTLVFLSIRTILQKN